MPVIIIGIVFSCIIGSCVGGEEISETTKALTTVFETVITTEHTTVPISVISGTTTVIETTIAESTIAQKHTMTTERKNTTIQKSTTSSKKVTTAQTTTITKKATTVYNGPETGEMVWIPESGKKYHSVSSCSNMKNPSKVTVSYAKNMGYTPCKKCY